MAVVTDRVAGLEQAVAALSERLDAVEDRLYERDDLAERAGALEECVLELLSAVRGIGGAGVVKRSPTSTGVAQMALARRKALNGD
jgi:hypothetical protein